MVEEVTNIFINGRRGCKLHFCFHSRSLVELGKVLSLWLHGLYSSFTVDLWDSRFSRGSSAVLGSLWSLFFPLLLLFSHFLLFPGLKLSVGWGHINFLYPEHPAASYATGYYQLVKKHLFLHILTWTSLVSFDYFFSYYFFINLEETAKSFSLSTVFYKQTLMVSGWDFVTTFIFCCLMTFSLPNSNCIYLILLINKLEGF